MTGEEIKSIARTSPEVMECAHISHGEDDPEKVLERLVTEGQSITEAMRLLSVAKRAVGSGPTSRADHSTSAKGR